MEAKQKTKTGFILPEQNEGFRLLKQELATVLKTEFPCFLLQFCGSLRFNPAKSPASTLKTSQPDFSRRSADDLFAGVDLQVSSCTSEPTVFKHPDGSNLLVPGGHQSRICHPLLSC